MSEALTLTGMNMGSAVKCQQCVQKGLYFEDSKTMHKRGVLAEKRLEDSFLKNLHSGTQNHRHREMYSTALKV